MVSIKTIFQGSVLLLVLTCFPTSGAVLRTGSSEEALRRTRAVSVPFIENKGQLDDKKIRYYTDTFAGRMTVSKDGGISYHLRSDKKESASLPVVTERPAGAGPKLIAAGRRAVTTANFYPGRDTKRWRTNLPTYAEVHMAQIGPGIDLQLAAYGNNVEKLFHIRSGSEAKHIRMQVEGARGLAVTADGRLKLDTPRGPLFFSRPMAYQIIGGRKKEVAAAYRADGTTYGFELGTYDRKHKVIIDPLINAFFIEGGQDEDDHRCMAIDPEGNVYIAGNSEGGFGIWKLDPRAETLLRTVSFGKGFTYGRLADIDIGSQGNVIVGGHTDSADFPTTADAFQPSFPAFSTGFAAKFDAELGLLAATYVGNDGLNYANAVAVDQNDDVYIAGKTSIYGIRDVQFPVSPDGFDTTATDDSDKAFIVKLDGNLENLLAGTYLGGNTEEDSAEAIAVDSSGNIVVAGVSASSDFPLTPAALDTSYAGENEGFISKFDPNLQHLLASTFIGGISTEKITAVSVAADDSIYLGGYTESSDFPTTAGGYNTHHGTGEDGFLVRVDAGLQTLMGGTFIGGNDMDRIYDISLCADGTIATTGRTNSADFPTTPDSHDDTYNTGIYSTGDGFVSVFDGVLGSLQYATYLGGDEGDYASGIACRNQNMYVTGYTNSFDFPFMPENDGSGYSKIFVTRFNPDETPPADPNAPVPSAVLTGHWQAAVHNTVTSIEVYMDLDLCTDGSFSGIWGAYSCVANVSGGWQSCQWAEDKTGEPVSGTLDFTTDSGSINMGECRGVPVNIIEKSVEKLTLGLHTKGNCGDLDFDVTSRLSYQGDARNCNAAGSSAGTGGSGDGGGGGCFVTTASPFNQ